MKKFIHLFFILFLFLPGFSLASFLSPQQIGQDPDIKKIYTGTYNQTTGTCLNCPSGWIVTNPAVGDYKIQHNLGLVNNAQGFSKLVCTFTLTWSAANSATLVTYNAKFTNWILLFTFLGQDDSAKNTQQLDFICILKR